MPSEKTLNAQAYNQGMSETRRYERLNPTPKESGSNAGVPVYQNKPQGITYNEAVELVRSIGIGKGQTFMDPDSVGATVAALGYQPNFMNPDRLREYFTPGTAVYVPPQERAAAWGIPVDVLQTNVSNVLAGGGISPQQGSSAVDTQQGGAGAVGDAPSDRQIQPIDYQPGSNATSPGTGAQPMSGGDRFSTGDPQLDDFLNNTYLPLLEAEFSGDPTAVLNSEVFNNISERVGKTFGPLFDASKQRIEQDVQLRQSGIDLSRREQTQGVESQLGQIGTERTRLTEDVGQAQKREARNFQTATQESAAAFASAGRAFGGGRVKAERKLQEDSQTRLSDIEQQDTRRREDLQRQESNVLAQQGFGNEQFGLQERSLGIDRARQESDLAGQRVLMEADERRRLRELGGSLLNNPEFLPTRQITI